MSETIDKVGQRFWSWFSSPREFHVVIYF